MSLPDFLIIGAQKSATSWLYSVLREHPHIWMPPVKELSFFNRIGQDGALPEKTMQRMAKRLYKERQKGGDQQLITYLWKLKKFPKADLNFYKFAFSWPVEDGAIKGEATPNYLEMSDEQVATTREILGPGKRIILMVRDPFDREISQLRMWVSRAEADGGKVEAIEDWHALYDAILAQAPCGDYRNGIPRWQKHFGAENLLIRPFGRVKRDPDNLIREIESFLGVAHFEAYSRLNEPKYVTAKVEIPAEILERVRVKIAGQLDYLTETFGPAFVALTK